MSSLPAKPCLVDVLIARMVTVTFSGFAIGFSFGCECAHAMRVGARSGRTHLRRRVIPETAIGPLRAVVLSGSSLNFRGNRGTCLSPMRCFDIEREWLTSLYCCSRTCRRALLKGAVAWGLAQAKQFAA